MTCYIDTRPRSSQAVFEMGVLRNDTIELTNVETRRKTIEDGAVFRKHYEAIKW